VSGQISWTDEHGIVHEGIQGSTLYVRCMRAAAGPQDPEPKPITCLFCLVFDLDAAMLYALQEMHIRGFTVDQDVLAELERKVQNMHRS
jgi:hypothetical protein